ncbi:MAG: protein YgfX [bacterium]
MSFAVNTIPLKISRNFNCFIIFIYMIAWLALAYVKITLALIAAPLLIVSFYLLKKKLKQSSQFSLSINALGQFFHKGKQLNVDYYWIGGPFIYIRWKCVNGDKIQKMIFKWEMPPSDFRRIKVALKHQVGTD